MKGLTLIEILIVIALLTALMGLTIPVGLRFLRAEQLASATDEVMQTLRRAGELSRVQERDSSYGVFFTSSSYTFFKGSSYSARDIVFDEIYDLPGGVTAVTNLAESDVVFGKLTGIPSESGIISLTNSIGSDTIEINGAGRISLVVPVLPPSCGGTPTACSLFANQLSCGSQEGCVWNVSAFCSGTYSVDCGVFSFGKCRSTPGCSWDNEFNVCVGSYLETCTGFANQSSCESQTGCTWIPAGCSGTSTNCDAYTDQVICESQQGCVWQ